MGLNCGMSFVKYILFIFNLIIVLASLSFVVIGIVVLVKAKDFNQILEGNVNAPGIALIAIGLIIFLIAFLGCCGAIRESVCMIYMYALLIIIIIVGQIALAAITFTSRKSVAEAGVKAYDKVFDKRNETMDIVKFVEENLECCGKENFEDWKGENSTTCKESNKMIGCNNALKEFIDKFSNLIGWFALGVVGIELVSLIFACCLTSGIKKGNNKVY